MLQRERVRLSERGAAVEGEEDESMLQHERECQSGRRSAQQCRESQLPLL